MYKLIGFAFYLRKLNRIDFGILTLYLNINAAKIKLSDTMYDVMCVYVKRRVELCVYVLCECCVVASGHEG